MHLLLAAETANEGGGVNVLPVVLVLIAIAVGLHLWKRKQ